MNVSDLRAIIQQRFGVEVNGCRLLSGEVDVNAFVSSTDGSRYVLKVHRGNADEHDLDMQDAALAHVDTTGLRGSVPRLVGREVVDTDDGPRVVRLLTWIDGRPQHDALRTDRRAIGQAVARVDLALRDFDHPALDRPYRWNMLQCDSLGAPSNPWAMSTLQAVRHDVLPALGTLPQQAIHNDANDDNIVVSDDGTVALIDYGDVVRGPRVIGLGVAVAYAMFGQMDPLAAGAEVLDGYHEVAPLDPFELALLDTVVRTRLAMSIAIAERQTCEQPDNVEYLTTSQASIARLVRLLESVPPAVAHATYRHACGYLPVAAERPIVTFFGSAEFDPASIVDDELSTARVLDWSAPVGRDQHVPDDEPALGRYGEIRAVYDTDAFETPFGERRTLHLGIDVFVPAGSSVRSPIDGIVHSQAVRDVPGDYGGVVILEYRTTDGTPFWMLVGHLDHASVAKLAPGDHLGRGVEFARVGTRAENGGWAPHIHVQLFTDLLGQATELDGVARASQRDVWMSISPSAAALVVGTDRHTVEADHVRASTDIARVRQTNLSPSLSLSYDEPLHIVGGDGATLIGADGRRWLDLVNNVAHVGHEHPRVVAAITGQVGRLNTNTRYLHANIVDYAERLRALFPDPLSVAFVTNSGSEAVDLSLRLARTTTGREGVLTLDWAYHGNLSSLVEISPYKFNRAGGGGPSDRVRICELPDPYRGRYGADGARYAEDVARQAHELVSVGAPPAAFVHESIPGCGGQIDLAPGYLEAAYAHARAAGALCIADEVQCGLGRTGSHWWAFEAHGVVPDIVAMGKPLGNGHPLGAVITTPRIARAFANGMEYFNTFGGNPVSCAAGLAVLDVVHDERLRAHAATVGAHVMTRLRDLAGRHPVVGDVRGRGLFIGIDLVEDPATRAPATRLAADTVEALKRRGILISSDGPHANVLKVKPPLVITAEELDTFVDALDEVLRS